MTRVIRAMCVSAFILPSCSRALDVSSTVLSAAPVSSTVPAAPTPGATALPASSPTDVAPESRPTPRVLQETLDELLRHLKVLPGPAVSAATALEESRAPEAPEVIVSASRIPMPASKIAGAVTVVSRAEAEAGHAADLGDAVARIPSVEVTRYGAGGATSGVTVRGSRAAQVLVMQDGRPLNSLSTGTANTSVVPFAAIDRVEIVRGPSGLLYGSGALGGVVNVITPEPPPVLSGEIAGEGGTFGTVSRRLRVGGPLGPVRVLAIESRTTSDGARPNAAFRGENLLVKSLLVANPGIELSGGLWGSALGSPGVKPAGDPALRTAAQTQFGNADAASLVDEQSDRRRFADARATWAPLPGHEASVRTYAEVNESNFRFGTFRYDAFFTPVPMLNNEIVGVQAQGVEGQYAAPLPLLTQSRVVAGAGWRKERLNGNDQERDQGSDLAAVKAGLRGRVEIGSVFTEWTLRPNEDMWPLTGLGLEGGVRGDRHSLFGDIANSHAGATYDLGPVAVKVAAGTAFRAPTISDLFWPVSPYDRGNPELRPERGRTMEGGLERRAGGAMVRVGVFQRTVRDQIDWAPDPAGVWSPSNVGRVTTSGDEVEAAGRWGRLTASGCVTVLRAVQRKAEVTQVDPLTFAPVATVVRERFPAHIPKYSAGAHLGIELPDGTGVAASMQASGERVMYLESTDALTGVNTVQVKRLKPHAVGAVRVTRKVAGGVTVSAGIENVTNAAWASHFGNDRDDQDYPMPGRTYYAGIAAAW